MCHKPLPKLSQQPSEQRNKRKEPIKFQSLTSKLPEARENPGNQNQGNQRCESQVRRSIENYF